MGVLIGWFSTHEMGNIGRSPMVITHFYQKYMIFLNTFFFYFFLCSCFSLSLKNHTYYYLCRDIIKKKLWFYLIQKLNNIHFPTFHKKWNSTTHFLLPTLTSRYIGEKISPISSSNAHVPQRVGERIFSKKSL